MLEKTHHGQAALWLVAVLAVIALIYLWLSQKPSSLTTSIPAIQTIATPTVTPTPTQTLEEVGQELKNLNSSATDIDTFINDTQLDVNQ